MPRILFSVLSLFVLFFIYWPRKRVVPQKLLARSREEGQGLVEYALILVLVAIIVIAVLLILGPTIGNVFSDIKQVLVNPESAGNEVLLSASATRTGMDTGNDVVVSISVASPTTVTVTDSQSGKSASVSCGGSCSVTLLGVGLNAGTITISGSGESLSAGYSAKK